jgi:hypothetical protein
MLDVSYGCGPDHTSQQAPLLPGLEVDALPPRDYNTVILPYLASKLANVSVDKNSFAGCGCMHQLLLHCGCLSAVTLTTGQQVVDGQGVRVRKGPRRISCCYIAAACLQ